MTPPHWATLPYRALLALMAIIVPITALPLALMAPGASAADEALPAIGSEIIVVLEDGDDPEAAAQAMGVEIKHVYRHVFNGFAGTVTGEAPVTAAAARARRAPKEISEDGRVRIEAQIIPTGVSRAGVPHQPGASNLDIPSPVDADIAILDTGIATLPDLNVAGGVNCIGGNAEAWHDDNGHGTHVAGIAAALDNDAGVVGVAPGARLWAVKVLDSSGGGAFSDVICGLDWVAGSAGTIDVANLSLSGEGKQGNCSDGGLHQAICAVVNAGVSVVVAAGNQSTNADNRVPASFPEVITVSGITDSDGQPGGLGPKPCFGDRDDVFLNFSNFGASVDIAAPGGCIISYNPAGGLETASGTSEASPHVAGAAAFFVGTQGSRPSPDQVRSWLLTQASRPQSTDGVGGDPDSGQNQSAATKKQIKKLKKKIKKSKGKKGGKGKKNKKGKKGKGKKQSQSQSGVKTDGKKKLKKKLRALKSQAAQDGHLEPVLWLAGLG